MTDETTEAAPAPPLVYHSVIEVARMFRVTQPTVRRWLAEGKMSYIKPAKKMLIPDADVRAFAAAAYGTPEEVASNGDD